MDGQTIFAVFIGAALGCFSLVMVGYAFFRGNEPNTDESSPVFPAADDGVGLESILDSIDTLELEHQLGNVPEAQYLELLESYRLQAAQAIKSLLESDSAPPELLLEQEILEARSAIPANDRPHEWVPCPQCDAPLPIAAQETPGGSACPHCGASMAASPVEEEMPRPEADAPSQAPVR